jgi:hypothetical protein
VKSRTTAQFRKAFAGLPEQVQEQAREAYRQFKQDPSHPSLRFKKVHPRNTNLFCSNQQKLSGSWTARDTVIWFWVGSHTEYDKLLSQL